MHQLHDIAFEVGSVARKGDHKQLANPVSGRHLRQERVDLGVQDGCGGGGGWLRRGPRCTSLSVDQGWLRQDAHDREPSQQEMG